jgi:2-polyprenyl-3-methyl-5-hydroxy-6-metoxy-1,4-benzoquinol methylase
MNCRICSGKAVKTLHSAPIRSGRFGNLTDRPIKVLKCQGCGAAFLGETPVDLKRFYESAAYRESVDGGTDASKFFDAHDAEQIRHLSVAGTGGFRGKTVADIGCGGGSFVDWISGAAATVVAIEPMNEFRESLKKRGYATYPYASEAARDYGGKVDHAYSFSVVEHIENPKEFMEEIRNLLRPGGELLLSTPNSDDVLMQTLPQDYPAFFYRLAHLWYFDAASLTELARIAGFEKIEVIPYQRFGMSNFIHWVRDRRPRGEEALDFVSPTLDAVWKKELERTFRCDYLFLRARRPA